MTFLQMFIFHCGQQWAGDNPQQTRLALILTAANKNHFCPVAETSAALDHTSQRKKHLAACQKGSGPFVTSQSQFLRSGLRLQRCFSTTFTGRPRVACECRKTTDDRSTVAQLAQSKAAEHNFKYRHGWLN